MTMSPARVALPIRGALLVALHALSMAACSDPPDTEPAEGGGGAGGTSGSSMGLTTTMSGAGGEAGAPSVSTTCTDAEYEAPAAPFVIVSQGVVYQPRCLQVPLGSTVRFESDFVTHPLSGGFVEDGTAEEDPDSPIPTVEQGEAVEVVFDEAGDFGFFCSHHAALGMGGFVRVVP